MSYSKFPCSSKIYPSVLTEAGPNVKLIGSIDQGTSSTRFLVFTQLGAIAAYAQMEHTQIFPTEVGRHEHDPMEIWANVLQCIREVMAVLKKFEDSEAGRAVSLSLEGLGITNQRETTIAWNASTGKPYYNAIVWDDLRTTSIASAIADGDKDRLRRNTGLPLASYFAGTKVRWLVENVPALREDLLDNSPGGKCDQVRFGTIDTWLVYQLTGTSSSSSPEDGAQTPLGNKGGLFITDVSNASRWLFLDIQTLQWDPNLVDAVFQTSPYAPSLLQKFPVATALPRILPSSHIYGTCAVGFGIKELENVPIGGILGDQQAALFGQGAFRPGEAKNTYGTGLFLMMNTGTKPMQSNNGLLTTVAYQIQSSSSDEPTTVYALEGSVSHSGSTIQWLRDQLQIIQNAAESESFATQTSSNDGLYLVPAFAGLFAPYWRSDARACIMGMTASHTKHHVCRAALESIAYQTRDVFDAIVLDSEVSLVELKVDGGGTVNRFLMQFQADTVDVPVVVPEVKETTALGAAFVAGLSVGVWSGLEELRGLWKEEERFVPVMGEEERMRNWKGWKKAITKSMGWVDEEEVEKGRKSNGRSSWSLLGIAGILGMVGIVGSRCWNGRKM